MNDAIGMYMLRFFVIVLVMVQITSCYSPTEGCLDPEATNYSITADNDCVDCCTYPDLSVSIFHESMDTTFSLGDTITNDLGQEISLVDFVFLLSDFKVIDTSEVYEVSDSVSLLSDDEELIVKDDIIRVKRSSFTYEIGTILFDGTTEELSFIIGLSDELNENRFTEEISDHPLTTDPDSLYQSDSDTYVFQRIQVAQGVDFLDTVIYDISTQVEVRFPVVITSYRGEDKAIIIEAQYDEWFAGIDFENMTKEEIELKIMQNSANLFKQKD